MFRVKVKFRSSAYEVMFLICLLEPFRELVKVCHDK